MSGFQIVSLTVLGLLLVATLVAVRCRQIARRLGLPWAVLWLAAGIAIAWPESTRLAADTLGIGRGADLVLYTFLLITMMGFFMTYVRLRRLETHITTLVRHVALQDPRLPEANGVASPGPVPTASPPDGGEGGTDH